MSNLKIINIDKLLMDLDDSKETFIEDFTDKELDLLMGRSKPKKIKTKKVINKEVK